MYQLSNVRPWEAEYNQSTINKVYVALTNVKATETNT